MRRLSLLFIGVQSLVFGCGEPVSPKAPQPIVEEPPREAPAPPPPRPEAAVHACEQDAAAESPIVEGALGDGDRLVQLNNNSGTDIQARILRDDGQPALPGTLVVKAGETGEFHVVAGVFMLRYRRKGNCEVRRGGKLHLTGPRSGVVISIKPSKDKTSDSKMEKVTEPL
jgi:hypothetical protein